MTGATIPEGGAAEQSLIVLGTGGNCLDLLDIVDAINRHAPRWRVVGILDDAEAAGGVFCGIPLLGALEHASRLAAPGAPWATAHFVNAIGSERTHAARAEIVARTGLPVERFATLVHPAAAVSARARIGRGCCIGFGASVGGQAALNDQVWIGPGCVIGHDSQLDAFALMAPRATLSGFVRVGRCCYVGSGATIRQRVTIGAGALVGMGAVVLRDVAPGGVVVGNPARDLARSR